MKRISSFDNLLEKKKMRMRHFLTAILRRDIINTRAGAVMAWVLSRYTIRPSLGISVILSSYRVHMTVSKFLNLALHVESLITGTTILTNFDWTSSHKVLICQMKTSISKNLTRLSIALSLQNFSLYRLGQFTEKSIFCRCLFGVFPFAFEHDKSLTRKEKYRQRPRNSHSLVFSLCCVPQCRASQQAKFRWSNIKAAPPKAVSSIFCQLPWIGYDEKL